jgi:membrane-bound lytic murein transglycosylase D
MMSPAPLARRSLQNLSLCALALLLSACASLAPPTPAPVVAAQPVPSAASAGPRVATPAESTPPAVAAKVLEPLAKPAEGASELPPDLRPIDPLRPDSRIDDDATAHADLWVRVRRGYAMPVLDSELVRKWEQYYAGKPDYMRRMTERGGRYLFHVVEEIEKRHMPTELALLPFIESAFNPQAMSSARASGMWQFIPSTGRDFRLKQNIFRDDRRDVLASTRAALDYLQKLHGMFGDWHLALAAYNWGEGSVTRAQARNAKAGLATDYASLNMPDETRNYVPKLEAMRNLIGEPEKFAVTLQPLANHPYFLSVPIGNDIDVATAVRLAELPLEEFRQLNPQMNKPVILAAGTPQVLLPYDNANAFVRNLSRHRGPLATWTAWVVPKTMKTAAAAAQVGMGEAHFREVNRIPPRMLVKAGSTLLVPRSERRQENVDEDIADNASLALAPDIPPLRRATFKAPRKGISVAAVARQYRMSVAQVAQINHVRPNGAFRAGQRFTVLVPQGAARAVVAAPTPGSTRVVTVKGRNGKLVKVVQKVKPVAVARGSARPLAKASVRVAARPAAAAARKPVRGNTKVRVAAR